MGWPARVVCVLAAPGRLEGARLWRVVNGAPTVWQESGELPAPDPQHIERILHGKNPHVERRESNVGAGTQAESQMGVLEARPKGELDPKTRGWLELFRRYAEVALKLANGDMR